MPLPGKYIFIVAITKRSRKSMSKYPCSLAHTIGTICLSAFVSPQSILSIAAIPNNLSPITIISNYDYSKHAAQNRRSPTPLLLRHRFIGFIGSTPHGPIGPIIVVVIAGITALSGNLDAASTPLRQHPKFLRII